MNKENLLSSKASILFVFRNKNTGEYVDEDGNPTEDLYESVGFPLYSDAVDNLKTFDEPEEWYIVKKLITVSIIGEPIEVTKLI